MINAPTLKTKDVAEKLQIDINTVLHLVERKELKAYRIGKSYRYFKEDVERYIESTKTK